jgi:hydrogenase/urease accessory protein HupE
VTRLLLLLVPTLAFAHPGHGHTEPTSWTHYLTEPVHVALLVIAAVTVLAWRRVLRTQKTP